MLVKKHTEHSHELPEQPGVCPVHTFSGVMYRFTARMKIIVGRYKTCTTYCSLHSNALQSRYNLVPARPFLIGATGSYSRLASHHNGMNFYNHVGNFGKSSSSNFTLNISSTAAFMLTMFRYNRLNSKTIKIHNIYNALLLVARQNAFDTDHMKIIWIIC